MDAVAARLVSNLHGIFDKLPDKDLAMRITHPSGLSWRLVGDTLFLTRPGQPEEEFELADKTIADLQGELIDAGYDVPTLNDEFTGRTALVLLEGEGSTDVSNGDRIYGYRSVLWALLDAIGRQMHEAQAQIAPALSQMILPQATGEWADYWGLLFGVPRLIGEADGDYTQRIIEEVKRARNNPYAILGNIHRLTGYKLDLREPWREVFMLSGSELSGGDHLQDDDEYRYHTAQLIAREYVDWEPIMKIAYQDKPAGTTFIAPASIPGASLIDGILDDAVIHFAGLEERVSLLWMLNDSVLSVNLNLSDYGIIKNYGVAVFELYGFYAGPAGQEDFAQIGPPITICKGEIALSEEPPLGDLQGRFPGYERIEIGAPMRLSDGEFGGLSDYNHAFEIRPIDEWFDANHAAASTEYAGGDVSMEAGGLTSMYAERAPASGWTGSWDNRTWYAHVVGMAITEENA